MLPGLAEASAMPVKKNSSNAKNSKNGGRRHAKLIAPKGEKVSSMKVLDASTPKLHEALPVHH
jgi:hypothetical protein